MDDVKKTRQVLLSPRIPQVLICSASEETLALLNTMLTGFKTRLVTTILEAHQILYQFTDTDDILDFVILDDQSESHADDLAEYLYGLNIKPFYDTKIIQLYTPTTSTSGSGIFANSTIPSVVKMTKPPRLARLLQTLADIKRLPHPFISHHSSDVAKAIEDLARAHRTLFGNVLIAEGVAYSSLRKIVSSNSFSYRQSDCPKFACKTAPKV
jgi:hypothetical protein